MWLQEADVILPSATWAAKFFQDHQEQELFLQAQILLSGIWDTLQPDSNSELLTSFHYPGKKPFGPATFACMKRIISIISVVFPLHAPALGDFSESHGFKCHLHVCNSPNYIYTFLLTSQGIYPLAYLTPLLWCLMPHYLKCDSQINTIALSGSLLELWDLGHHLRLTESESAL